jgi:excisionase family DNA binding protein
MTATNETGATETAPPSAQPGSATAGTVVLSVDEAADLLGVTPQAVRKRIKAGTLPARRDGRAWRVFLERATDETRFCATDRNRPQPETKPVAQSAQLQAQQLAVLVEPFTAPLVAKIEALSHENGRLEAERDAALKAVEAMREENAFLRAVQDERAQKPGTGNREASEPSHDDSARPGATGEVTSAPETEIGPPAWRRAEGGHELGQEHRESIVAAVWRRLFGRG